MFHYKIWLIVIKVRFKVFSTHLKIQNQSSEFFVKKRGEVENKEKEKTKDKCTSLFTETINKWKCLISNNNKKKQVLTA